VVLRWRRSVPGDVEVWRRPGSARGRKRKTEAERGSRTGGRQKESERRSAPVAPNVAPGLNEFH